MVDISNKEMEGPLYQNFQDLYYKLQRQAEMIYNSVEVKM